MARHVDIRRRSQRSGTRTRPFDLVVIGGGSAGLVSALVAAGIGARVALVESARTGGDCLWRGCVPSKTLLASAEVAHLARTATRFGLRAELEPVDLTEVMARVRQVQDSISPHDSPERLRAEGIEVIEGRARFVEQQEIEVCDPSGERTAVGFRRAIVATGSVPIVPIFDGGDAGDDVPPLLTTDSIWELDELPRRLVVVGGGAVGCELGQAFHRLGSAVTIVELGDRLLPGTPARVGRTLRDQFASEGLAVRTGRRVTGITRSPDPGSARRLRLETGPDIDADQVLVAIGRRPRTDGLGLDAVGVETDEAGAVVVDDHLRTTARHIWAVGDVTGVRPLTSVADLHARAAAPNAVLGTRRRADVSSVPTVVYTDPEVATVGVTDRAASWVGAVDHVDLDRHRTSGDVSGYTELVADQRGVLVGATVVGPAAGEIVGEVAAWIRRGAKLTDLAANGRAYPAYGAGISRVADQALRARYERGWLTAAGRLAVRARALTMRSR